ncbi:MAG: hypothetical protein J1D88_07570 [Treponema sp.]|nr:hypothetical protein [Treponema sp.]
MEKMFGKKLAFLLTAAVLLASWGALVSCSDDGGNESKGGKLTLDFERRGSSYDSVGYFALKNSGDLSLTSGALYVYDFGNETPDPDTCKFTLKLSAYEDKTVEGTWDYDHDKFAGEKPTALICAVTQGASLGDVTITKSSKVTGVIEYDDASDEYRVTGLKIVIE